MSILVHFLETIFWLSLFLDNLFFSYVISYRYEGDQKILFFLI